MINAEIEHDLGMKSLRRWNAEQHAIKRATARRGWIASLLAALAVLYLFILTARADEFTPAGTDPVLGFDWLPWLVWTIVALVAAVMIWQVKASLPIILGHDTHDDSPEDRLDN